MQYCLCTEILLYSLGSWIVGCIINTNVNFLILVPPNIIDDESSPSSVSIRENQNLSLTCKAEGSPTPKISWKREDGNHIAMDRKKKGIYKTLSVINTLIIKINEYD